MKKNLNTLKTKFWLPLIAVVTMLASYHASAQTVIAKWTFESLPTGLSYVPGNGVSTTNFYAELGTQAGIAAITGKHGSSPVFGTPTYSLPAGNGSAKSLSANGWTNTPGDYWQFAVNATGFTNLTLTFDAVGSGTGPKDFKVMYSTDGVTFTQFSTYAVLSSPSWSAGAAVTGETYTFDFSSITSLANNNTVYIRLVDNSNVSASGGIVGTGGTSRLDNAIIAGTIAGPPQIITQPANTTNFFGDTATFTVIAGGDAPLSYQWYTNSTPLTPLTEGPSGFGSGTNSATTNSTMTFFFVNTNQTGNYRVVITNPLGSITSSVVHLQVIVRTPIVTNIAYIHKLHDTNFVLTDTTNIYVLEGVVTTPINLVSGPTEVESFFMQDTNTGAGCDVFYRGGFPFPALGDHVRVTAPAGQFNGLIEMSPVNGNPAHKIEILDNNYPLPAPQFFDFTTLPTASNMEEVIEGRYMIVSNVFVGVATNVSGHFTAGGTLFLTNGSGAKFTALVPNNPAIDIVGNSLTATFAKSIRGVMSQSQTSGTVLTNGYSILLAQGADFEPGTPVTVNPDSYTVITNTTSTFRVLTNDSVLSPDATPRTLTVTAVSTTNGLVTIVDNTNIVFTPDTDFVGSLTITYSATDNVGYVNTGGVITVTVISNPTPPSPIPLGISLSGGNLTFTWTNASFSLQSSTNVFGPYTTITGAGTGFSTNTAAAQMFFRLVYP